MPALVFDYDGLMIDSERVLAEAVVELVAERGGTLDVGDIAHLFGTTEADAEWERLAPTWCDPPLSLSDLVTSLTPVVRARIDELPLLPGVGELVAAAADEGWKLAIATGHERDRLEAKLAALGVRDAFDAIVTSAEVPRGKPAPDIFLEVARRLDVPPRDCVVLEDSVPGCEAALAAGMAVIACPSTVTAHLRFPDEARRVATLHDVRLCDLLRSPER